MGFEHVDAAALKKVHDTLKRDIGAVRILFGTGAKPLTPSIKEVTQDIIEQYHIPENEKAAVLYLVTLARVKGTETAEYHSFVNVLKRPPPKAPISDEAFLPYLSFLCEPAKTYKVNKYEPIDGVKKYSPHQNDSVVPPHPSYVAKPMPPNRNSFHELIGLMKSKGPDLTYFQFMECVKDVDGGLTKGDIQEIFTRAAHQHGEKSVSEKTKVPWELLLEVSKPDLTLLRQKTRDSKCVKGAMEWNDDGFNSEPTTLIRNGAIPPPVTGHGTSRSLGGAFYIDSVRRPANSNNNNNTNGGSNNNSARSTKSSPGSSPRGSSPRVLGGKPTKSAELRLTLSKENQNDPNSPRYKGEYRHIPLVPETNFRKTLMSQVESAYTPRKLMSIPHAPHNPHAGQQAAPQQGADGHEGQQQQQE